MQGGGGVDTGVVSRTTTTPQIAASMPAQQASPYPGGLLVLALDTATSAVTAGLVQVDGSGVSVVAERATIDARKHGEALAPQIAECLAVAGATPADLGAIVAGIGPGPFTGLRVGLVTAASMADALGVPLYGVCTLDAIAVASAPAGTLLVASDARRKEIYWAVYGPDSKRLTEPAVGKPADVRELLAEQPELAVGTGARLYADVLGLPIGDVEFPTVEALVRCALPDIESGAAPSPLVPLYLRRPDAVEPAARKPVLG